jgi:dTDP-glucose 4,6-dehydratase/UDP-glucuronate decarboxylase
MSYPYNHSVILRDCKVLAESVDISSFKNKNILITGANGMIGSFLSDFFCYLNDNFDTNIKLSLTSYSRKHKVERLKNIVYREDVHYFGWDASTPIDVESAFLGPIDSVFFCSGYAQPSKFLKNNIKTSLINVIGLESILNHLQKNGGGDFAFLSTSELYGDPPIEMLPTSEEYGGMYELDNNRAAYKVSKTMGEVLCKEYNNFDNMNVKIFRVALTYGPGTLYSDERVLQEFIFKAVDKGFIQMFDEGSSIRNYLYIVDSVRVFINCLIKGKHLVYNVGGDREPTSIYELANKIGKCFDVNVVKGKSKVNSVKTAPKNVRLDMNKYRNEFSNDNNFISLDEGIKNIIEWFDLDEYKRN